MSQRLSCPCVAKTTDLAIFVVREENEQISRWIEVGLSVFLST